MWNEEDLPLIISKGYFALSDITDLAAKRFLLGGDIDDYVDVCIDILNLLYALIQRDIITYQQYENLINHLIKTANLS